LYVGGTGVSAAEGTDSWEFEGPEGMNLELSKNTDSSIGGTELWIFEAVKLWVRMSAVGSADMYSLWGAGTSSIWSAEMSRVFGEEMTWSWVPGRACVGDIVLFCIEWLSCIDNPQIGSAGIA
jgi:hypothetical protein